jgi:hypothetical protein
MILTLLLSRFSLDLGVMMSFGSTGLSASMLARVRPGAICATFFVCFSSVWAQSIPEGYVASREGDIVVMRPSAAPDPDIAIRVYPQVADDHDPDAVLHHWAESNPPAGVDPRALILQDKTVIGVSTLVRIWKDGAQAHLEFIMMPQAGPGRYRPVVARMPSQQGELLNNQSQAMGRVVAEIMAGKFQPDIPPGGKGNSAVSAAPAEPAGRRTAPERPAPGRASSAETQAPTDQLARALAQIETVGFTTRTEMGVGGMFLYLPKPVALFRSGDALLEMGKLNRVTSVVADRAAHPTEWGRWRRTAVSIELMERDKWKKLDYSKTAPRLSAGFVLSGNFERLTGGGDTAVGGKTMMVGQSRYTFRPDGTFSRDRSGSINTEAVGWQTFASSSSPVQQGRYQVDGYLLRLEPAGGQPETHVIATYPTDPSIIWIDGLNYTRPVH